MRHLILPLLLLLSWQNLHSQSIDIITTKNGDSYEGYISRQIPGKELTVFSFKSIITVSRHDVDLARKHKVMLGDLSPEYQMVFPGLEDDAYVDIADVTIERSNGKLLTFKSSAILEEGEDVKFASFSRYPFDLKWSEIWMSEKVPYDLKENQGFIDKIILQDAKIIEGQFLGQNLSTGILKFKSEEGSVMSFRKSEVQAIRFESRNPDVDVWTQLPYCDKVICEDGSTICGFIQSKVFGKYITILNHTNGESTNVRISDIVSYEKYPNVNYEKPKENVIEEELADLYLNGISYPTTKLHRKHSFFIVGTCVDSLRFVSRVNNNVVIKYKANARTGLVRLAKTKLKKEKIFGMSGISLRKKSTDLWPVFSKKDILSGRDINFQSNDGDYIVADITFCNPGVYVLWIEGSDTCVPLNIKSY